MLGSARTCLKRRQCRIKSYSIMRDNGPRWNYVNVARLFRPVIYLSTSNAFFAFPLRKPGIVRCVYVCTYVKKYINYGRMQMTVPYLNRRSDRAGKFLFLHRRSRISYNRVL